MAVLWVLQESAPQELRQYLYVCTSNTCITSTKVQILTQRGSVWQLPAVLKNPDAYVHSTFFTEQLTGFEVWLELGTQLPRFTRTKALVQLVQKHNY